MQMRWHQRARALATGMSFAAAALGGLPSATAQQSQQAQSGGAGLEEIVVTAQRREENLQETPVTVTAITATQLEQQGITTTQDIAKAVPNLQLLPLTANPSTFQIGLRGGSEQTGGLIVSEPVVGLYVDDVYRGRLQGANFQLSDVERVEVLRGPQGTLYGRNTFSGAIKIITRTPSAENEWLDLSAGYGSFSEFNVQGSIGRGLTETVGASLAVLYRDQSDGWITNRAQGRRIGAEENLSVRGKLAYADGPIKAAFSVSYGKDENDGYIPAAIRFTSLPPGVPFPSNRATSITTSQVAPRYGSDPYIAEYPQPSRGETKTTAVTLDFSYDFGNATLRSITGYVDLDDYFRWDIAAGLRDPMTGAFSPSFDRASDATADQVSQELQLLGTAANDRLDWIVGLYYFDESGDQRLDDEIPLFFLPRLAPTFLQTDTQSWAIFGQATWKFTDRFSMTLGGRQTEDDKDFFGDIQSGFGVPVPRTQVQVSRKFDSFTPKIGADVKFTDSIFGYFTASKGFKAGGFNGLSVLNPVVLRAVYEPQEVNTYELGIKADWLDRRLRTNVTYFYNDISDLQQTANAGGGSFAQQNIGDATVQGLEAEITAQPIDGLNLFAILGWMDGEYDNILPTSQAFTAGARDLPLVTDVTWQLGFSYERPIGDRLVFRLGADGKYIGDHWVEVTNSIFVKGYDRYDAFIGLGSADGKWSANLMGRNLSDEVNYVTGIISNPNPALATLRPRQWMFTVTYRP